MKNILISKATNKDSKSIINLIFDIWHNEYGFAVKKEDFPDLANIDSYYSPNSGLFLAAKDGDALIGTIACNKLAINQWVLKRMFVKKSHRRQGLAQRLLNKLLTELHIHETNNQTCLFLSTKEHDAASAKAFYLKNGFEAISKSRLPSNFSHFYEDDLFMMKSDIKVIA